MRIFIVIFISALLGIAATPSKADPPKSSNWVAIEMFSDEFEAKSIDATKWYALNPKWQGRPPSRFAKENVFLRGGKLVILGNKVSPTDPWAKDGIQFKTGILKSQRPIKYGYFEIKARVATSRISSAFWLYDHSPTTWTEIDIFELCGAPSCSGTYHTNAHARIENKATSKLENLEFKEKFRSADLITDGSLTAGLEWDENYLRWYVNGKMIRQLENVYWHEPLFIVLDSEVFLDWFGRPDDKELPSEFAIDYIRAWQRAK